MDDKMENIDRYISERLVNYEQDPPDANWEKISLRLSHKQRKRSAILIFRIAAGMALLLSTGIGVYILTKPDSKLDSSAISANQHNEVTSIRAENKTASVHPVTPGHNNIAKKGDLLNAGKQQASKENSTTGNSGKQKDQSVEAFLADNHRSNNVQHLENEKSAISSMTAISGKYSDRLQQKDLSFEIPFELAQLHPENVVITTPDHYSEDYTPEENQAKKPDRWRIGSEVAPLYSYRTISSDKLQSATMDELNNKENGLLAYSGGISVAFSTGKRLSVQSGVYYSRYGQQTNNIETVAINYLSTMQGKLESQTYVSIANSTGVISRTSSSTERISVINKGNIEGESDNIRYGSLGFGSGMSPSYPNTGDADMTLTQYFDYLEVPLMLKYKMIDRKIDFNLTGGVITNFLFSNRVNMTHNGDTEFFGETTDINYINYQGSVGMGIEYPVKSGFSFTIEPRFRYYINPIDKTAEINVHPYSFGFYAGFNYSF